GERAVACDWAAVMSPLLPLRPLPRLALACRSAPDGAVPEPPAAAVSAPTAAAVPPRGEADPDAPAWNCSARVELSSLWASVRRNHDADGDGRVTTAEYTRGQIRFANYDRNGDGTLDASDFPTDTHFNGFSHMILEDADADGDEAVTTEEWWDFCATMDGDGNGTVSQAEAAEVLGPWSADWPLFLLSFDQDGDGDFDAHDLEVTFADQDYDGDGVLEGKEMSGWVRTVERPEDDPPAVGDAAPDFELTGAGDPGRVFRLSDAVRERPVALVFGSYT
ncbi:MAG: hypothetical protein AAGB93_24230, partial [Planctomycetota bacterium]